MTVTDQEVYEVLKMAFPGLEEGHFRIMKQTKHDYWLQAVEFAEKKKEKTG